MSAFASRPTWAAIALFVAGHGFLCAQTRWGIATPLLPFYGSTLAAYDPVARRAVVLDTTTCSTWSVASSTGVWTQVAFQTVPIGYVSDASMVWDTVRQRAVLFGGFDPNGPEASRAYSLFVDVWKDLEESDLKGGGNNKGIGSGRCIAENDWDKGTKFEPDQNGNVRAVFEKLRARPDAKTPYEPGMRLDRDDNFTVRSWQAVVTYLLTDYRFTHE